MSEALFAVKSRMSSAAPRHAPPLLRERYDVLPLTGLVTRVFLQPPSPRFVDFAKVTVLRIGTLRSPTSRHFSPPPENDLFAPLILIYRAAIDVPVTFSTR